MKSAGCNVRLHVAIRLLGIAIAVFVIKVSVFSSHALTNLWRKMSTFVVLSAGQTGTGYRRKGGRKWRPDGEKKGQLCSHVELPQSSRSRLFATPTTKAATTVAAAIPANVKPRSGSQVDTEYTNWKRVWRRSKATTTATITARASHRHSGDDSRDDGEGPLKRRTWRSSRWLPINRP